MISLRQLSQERAHPMDLGVVAGPGGHGRADAQPGRLAIEIGGAAVEIPHDALIPYQAAENAAMPSTKAWCGSLTTSIDSSPIHSPSIMSPRLPRSLKYGFRLFLM